MGKVGRLTTRDVQNAKPKGDRRAAMFADGANLYLQATRNKSGDISRSWV